MNYWDAQIWDNHELEIYGCPKLVLPDRPEPKHAPMYYTLDPESGRPIPGEYSVIRGTYISRQD